MGGEAFPEPSSAPELHEAMHECGRSCVVIYPGPGHVPLTECRPVKEVTPMTLIFVDGRWKQAKAMYNRSPWLRQLPCAAVYSTTPSSYGFRRQPVEGCLSTLEAVAEALVELEGDRGAMLKDAFTLPFQRMATLQCAYIPSSEENSGEHGRGKQGDALRVSSHWTSLAPTAGRNAAEQGVVNESRDAPAVAH